MVMTPAALQDKSADEISKMSFEDLVASLSGEISDAELEAISIEDQKTTVGPLRVPVLAFAELSKAANAKSLSVSNFVLDLIAEATGQKVPHSEGKGRKKKEFASETERKNAMRIARARQEAQVQKILAELGVS